MHRVHIPPGVRDGDVVSLPAAEAHYVAHVIRRRVGDVLMAFDGAGQEWHVRLVKVSPAAVEGQVNIVQTPATVGLRPIVLGQALPKSTKMDLIVEKCSELGLTTLVPLHTERTVVHEVAERMQTKLARWRRVAEAAARQSGRRTLLGVQPPRSLPDFCAHYRSAPVKIVCWEGEPHRGLRQALDTCAAQGPLVVLIGPEGGLTTDEIVTAQAHGFLTASLGPRILRTETAAIAVTSIIRYCLGELEPHGEQG
jgi:16S rRNA (uracil1498-N3)-methyltransferase